MPQAWAEDPRLANWVSSQRANKKKWDRGEPSHGMTAARAATLEALGLVWAPGPKSNVGGRRKEAQWEAQLVRLASYKSEHGDCNVPKGWAEDAGLASWVNNQRYSKKKLDCGQPSWGMTAARAAKLEALGFVWELSAEAKSTQRSKGMRNDTGWGVWLAKLKVYKRKHGDCNVPRGWAEDPRLGHWVKEQRTTKKELDRGDPSNGMTAERAAKLEALGLAWAPGVKSHGGRPNEAQWEAQLVRQPKGKIHRVDPKFAS